MVVCFVGGRWVLGDLAARADSDKLAKLEGFGLLLYERSHIAYIRNNKRSEGIAGTNRSASYTHQHPT